MLMPGGMNVKAGGWKAYLFWIVLAEGVGALSGWLARAGAEGYGETIALPPFSPPGAVFPIVWGVLFALMGVGAARIWLRPASGRRLGCLVLFLVQLAFNACWAPLFFNLRHFGLALVWLLALWALIIWMIGAFHPVDAPAAWLQLPYLLWVSYAACLNLGVWLLN